VYDDLPALRIGVENQVATIKLRKLSVAFQEDPPADPHIDLPTALERMRIDDSIRVIVITGEDDDEFLCAGSPDYYRSGRAADRLADPYGQFPVGQGVLRMVQAMIEIEKPVIARVNGDAIGFGQSVVLASDFIIAREDAYISDVHLGMGRWSAAAAARRSACRSVWSPATEPGRSSRCSCRRRRPRNT